MHARVTGAKYNGHPYQSAGATGPRKTPGTSAATVSTDALRIGLAHFIHEINTPLQMVYWAADVMDTHMPKANGSGDPFAGKIFQELKGGVDQLVSLVSSLESQLKSLWMIDPCFDSVNLNSLIVEVIQSDAARFAAGGIRVDTDIAAALPALQADAKLLRQVFVNLFRNAADAMPEGGVLSVSAGARAGSVWLEIADTGSGIAPDLDAFQPFATSKPRGMGLGLAITRHIVELHGGTITYRSEPGKGTTFCLKFPSSFGTKKISVRRAAAADDSSERFFGCLCHAPEK
jgi:two-component system sensor histidine kinase DctS